MRLINPRLHLGLEDSVLPGPGSGHGWVWDMTSQSLMIKSGQIVLTATTRFAPKHGSSMEVDFGYEC